MRLLRLDVEGFRSLKAVSWEPRSSNLVIGASGSGKTNLLRALELLAEAARGTLDRCVIEGGGMGAMAWDGEAPLIKLRIRTSPIDPERDVERDSLTYLLHLARIGQTSAYRIDAELLGNFYRVETGERSEPLKLLERNTRHAVVFDEQARALVPQEEVNEEETLLSHARGPFGVNRLIAAYQKTLASWQILRGFQTHERAEVRRPAPARRDHRLRPDGQNLAAVLHTHTSESRAFRESLNGALRVALGPSFEDLVFAPAGDDRIEMRLRWRTLRRDTPAADASDGVLRFLYVYTALAAPKRPPLLAIEEPEAGLHPGMLPLIADAAKRAAESSQVILTTATPALLDACSEPPHTMVLEWSGEETQLQDLGGDELEDWLVDYSAEAGHSDPDVQEGAPSRLSPGSEVSEAGRRG